MNAEELMHKKRRKGPKCKHGKLKHPRGRRVCKKR